MTRMTMTQTQMPPRRSNGCLWGCLAVLAFIFLPVIVAGGYGAWFLYQGFRHDPVLRTVSELLRRDGMAHQVLGDDIHVTGVSGNAFSFTFVPGVSSHTDYEVMVSGDKASGTLEVEADNSHGHVDVQSMTLTLPNGARYDLLHNQVLKEPEGSQSI